LGTWGELETGLWWRKTGRKRQLGTHRRRRNDNIIMDVKEIWCVDVDLAHLTQDWDRLTGWCENGNEIWVPYGRNFLTS
jgi:hypothetical protein